MRGLRRVIGVCLSVSVSRSLCRFHFHFPTPTRLTEQKQLLSLSYKPLYYHLHSTTVPPCTLAHESTARSLTSHASTHSSSNPPSLPPASLIPLPIIHPADASHHQLGSFSLRACSALSVLLPKPIRKPTAVLASFLEQHRHRPLPLLSIPSVAVHQLSLPQHTLPGPDARTRRDVLITPITRELHGTDGGLVLLRELTTC
jgi:hypothetical protein